MRIVVDTVIFVRGLINPQSACGRLLFIHADKFELIVSKAIVTEYLEVLHRPEIVRKYRKASDWSLAAVLAMIDNAPIVEPEAVLSVSRDPGDDKFLALAAAAEVAFLVSEDLDLLVLGSYEGAQICSTAAFLRQLGDPMER